MEKKKKKKKSLRKVRIKPQRQEWIVYQRTEKKIQEKGSTAGTETTERNNMVQKQAEDNEK